MDDSVTRVVEEIQALWPEAREYLMEEYGHELVTDRMMDIAATDLRLWYAIRGHKVSVTVRCDGHVMRFTLIPSDIRKVTITGVVE